MNETESNLTQRCEVRLTETEKKKAIELQKEYQCKSLSELFRNALKYMAMGRV